MTTIVFYKDINSWRKAMIENYGFYCGMRVRKRNVGVCKDGYWIRYHY